MGIGWRVAALTLWSASACGPANGDEEPREDQVPQRSIEEVQEDRTPEWLCLPGVVGTGIGHCDGEPCIKVFLATPSRSTEGALPDSVEGHRVEAEVTGTFRPRTPPDTGSDPSGRSGSAP